MFIIRLALLLCLGTLVMSQPIRFLSQQLAQQVDIQLMSPTYGFSIDQLMELAGLSVASAITHHFPITSFASSLRPRVGIICGPGNNGGDGLVAARHLYHFGFAPEVVYPKAGSGPLFQNLIKQLQMLDIPIRQSLPDDVDTSYALLVDAIFGFSFRGALRPPFDTMIDVPISLVANFDIY
jgi:NAD(P)H-hydrate epimerase